MTSYAKVIADSISPEGVRLTTIEGSFRRFVLAEANTHRVISKNSSSSRAIPFAKMIARIKADLAYPEVWASEQKGMQGGVELGDLDRDEARRTWELAAQEAINIAEDLAGLGVHKSIVNRVVEPFMWHTVVFTATAWENFFAQRCSPLAQPEIRVFAEAVHEAMAGSTPQPLKEGEWHLPYFNSEDWEAISDSGLVRIGESMYPLAVQISSGRCARTSYLTQDGRRDITADLNLYAKLTAAEPPHWSPLEHVATPWPANRQEGALGFFDHSGHWRTVGTSHLPRVGNLLGWRSLRTEEEARKGVVTFR